jgi:Na+-translocating ferredoxin:NAD+ oxidoreductase RnfC subunit
MADDIAELVKNAGVVGAGGAGFPTHVKLRAKCEIVIANGAECEPLLRADQSLMRTEADRVVAGLEAAASAVGAETAVIATKRHYTEAVAALTAAIGNRRHVRLHLMDSYYPAGDEKSLIYDITARVVPGALLPSDLGCVVVNVGTLVNIADALDGRPVTHRYVTVGGDVPKPVTLRVPIGTAASALLPYAGFTGTRDDYAMIAGGPCMGKPEENWDAPVTKTTAGILLFRRLHPVIIRRTVSRDRMMKLAKAVCCQCAQCTQLCPRNALGLNVNPHKVMRAAAAGDPRLLSASDVNGLLSCSGCGLCTNYACNFGLQPADIMTAFKDKLMGEGLRPAPEAAPRVDSALRLKRVPIGRLMARMGLSAFDAAVPLAAETVTVKRIRAPLRMGAGKAADPAVSAGDRVDFGGLLARAPENALGAAVHSGLAGRVAAVTDAYMEVEA